MENTHLDPAPATPPDAPKAPRPAAAAARPAEPGADLRALGPYRILRRLGEGGMGAVYLAYHGREDRQVAIKVLNEQLSNNNGYVARFRSEAKTGARLDHPNLVRTLASGHDRASGRYFLVMEYVDGPSAHALLAQKGKLSVGDAVHIALDVARALEHAHSRSIIHRDIKPDNILITHSGVCKLGDLGLAKRTDEPSHLTATRQGFGTTAYMPYEQALNAREADGRGDLYALGATLYHLVTGSVPFPGDNHLEVVERKGRGYFIPAGALNPDVPAALDDILSRMLARDPRDRYQTASELIIDLERSRLSATVPSFADPELARRDPWLQACQTSSEPTRLDPEGTPVAVRAVEGEIWLLRTVGRDGRPRTVRATAAQILSRLATGAITPNAQVRRPEQERFRPVGTVTEFRDAPTPEPEESKPPIEISRVVEPKRRKKSSASELLVLAMGLVLALAVGVLLGVARWLLHT
jgi:eukaryotic-like serine/threonine-protein kinase